MRKITSIVFLALLITSVFSSSSAAQSTPGEGTWIDTANISYDGSIYTDRKIGDEKPGLGGRRNYRKDGQQSGCIRGEIDYKSDTLGRLRLREVDSETGECRTVVDQDIILKEPEKARLWFYRVDNTTLRAAFIEYETDLNPTRRTTVIKGSDYKLDPAIDRYLDQAAGDCKSSIQVTSPTEGIYYPRGKMGGNCHEYNDFMVRIGDIASAPPGTTTGPPVESGDGAVGTSTAEGCEFRANPLSWIACPVLGAIRETLRAIDKLVVGYLYTDLEANEYQTGGPLYQSWSVFRYIALSIVVVVTLVMVVAQALAGMFDAYSFKKLLPKLLVAVVLIALSWILTTFFIDVINTVALSIRSLFYLPFGGERTIENHVFNLGSAELAATNVGLIYGAVAAASLGIMGILSLAATILFGALIALLILTFRKVIILLLVVTAPIAIACSVLPNTEKVWKFWKDSFIKVLVMFPVIMMVIAAGHVVSYIAIRQGGGLGNQAIALGAYGFSYWATIAAAKASSSIASKLTGIAGSSTKGIFDRQRNYRQKIQGVRKKQKEQANLLRLGNTSGGIRGSFNRARGRSAYGIPISGGIRQPSKEYFGRLSAQATIEARNVEIKNATLKLKKDLESRKLYGPDAAKELANIGSQRNRPAIEREAAVQLLAEARDVKGLEQIQRSFLQQGDDTSWKSIVDKNFGALKEVSPHLTATFDQTDVSNYNTAVSSGLSVDVAAQQTMQNNYAKSFNKTNDVDLAKLGEDQWAAYARADAAKATERIVKIFNQPNLQVTMNGKVKDAVTRVSSVAVVRDSSGNPMINPTTGTPLEAATATGINLRDSDFS